MRILYIEDDEGLLYLLRQSLEAANFDVVCAAEGESGLALLQNQTFDAIVIDQELPQMTGLEVIERMQVLEQIPPIIMVTGAGTEEIAVEAMRKGASDYLVKDTKLMYLQMLPSKIRQVIREREIEQAQQAAERALQLEKDRSTLLSRFIQDASHEFRTPLSVIHTSTELLSRISDNPKQIAYIQRIQQQAGSILSLVTDLIKLAELDSKVSLPLDALDLSLYLRTLMPRFEHMRRTHQIEFCLTLPETPLYILGNVGELEDCLRELFDNACRYSTPGSTVFIDLAQIDDKALLTIRDTSMGISEEALPHIFERFYRVDISHSTPGFGLGLSIAERIVQLHGGSIQTGSSPGQGTIVTVTLPLSEGT